MIKVKSLYGFDPKPRMIFSIGDDVFEVVPKSMAEHKLTLQDEKGEEVQIYIRKMEKIVSK